MGFGCMPSSAEGDTSAQVSEVLAKEEAIKECADLHSTPSCMDFESHERYVLLGSFCLILFFRPLAKSAGLGHSARLCNL